MISNLFRIFAVFLCVFTQISFSQGVQDSLAKDTVESRYKRLYSADDPLFQPEEKEEKDFKKKKDFWGFLLGRKIDGYRTRKGFAQSGGGRSRVYESFRVAKKWNPGSVYVQNKYYYDPFQQKIVKKRKIKPEDTLTLKPLHGQYRKIVGEDTIQEGYFYMGMMHGRWVQLKKPKEKKFADTTVTYQQLKGKENWYKGFPRDAEMVYYESDRTKLKEVTPYMNGDKTGMYYRFFKDGRIEAKGKYKFGYKVGRWSEYYNRRKGTYKRAYWEFPKDPFYDDIKDEHYLISSWAKDGTVEFTKDPEVLKKQKSKKR